jgi:hypothetical protein
MIFSGPGSCFTYCTKCVNQSPQGALCDKLARTIFLKLRRDISFCRMYRNLSVLKLQAFLGNFFVKNSNFINDEFC